MYTEVVVGAEITSGRTVVDIFGMLAKGKKRESAMLQHVLVATDMNVELFWELMLSAVEKANSAGNS